MEQAAVAAHLQLAAWTQLPICYVIGILDVLTPFDVLMLGHDGPRSTAGSGSAYHLVPAARPLPFDEVFGTAHPNAGHRRGAA